MTEDRFIILTAAYERHAGRGPLLEWIAPELKDAGLSLIEDNHHGWNPSSKWAGPVDGPTFGRFADAWHLQDDDDEPGPGNADGHPTMHAHPRRHELGNPRRIPNHLRDRSGLDYRNRA